jgi:chaperone BCS1
MDVWLNFRNATRWQAEGIFKNFFPCKPSGVDTPAPSTPDSLSFSTPTTPTTEAELGAKRRTHLIPVLEEEELCALAKRFAEQIPEDELSVSTLSEFFCPFPRI